jgi:hypothetical protein
MDLRFRSIFNRAYAPEISDSYQRDLSRRLGCEIPFRLAETPVFLPPDLVDRLGRAGSEIIGQLSEPARLAALKKAIPEAWDAPGMDALPNFAQVDFAVVREDDGSLAPRLIELQGFPSLTAFEVAQYDSWAGRLSEIPGLDSDWTCWFSGLGREGFLALARRTILGSHRPEDVILMDLDPPSQKTFPDFAATKGFFGVEPVCATALVKEGRKLYRRLSEGGRLVPVERIYNRVVFDELLRKDWALPFDFRDELDVEWAPHPNWYWAWSKFSLPFLDHPAVPKATLLADMGQMPSELSRFVLKPLFSFAGGGVNVEPSPADLERVPEKERRQWCLQEKIAYTSALAAADGGGVKVEIRLMFLRPDDEPVPVLAQNLCRLSRGKMHGVDFNKDFSWVGSSVGVWPAKT